MQERNPFAIVKMKLPPFDVFVKNKSELGNVIK